MGGGGNAAISGYDAPARAMASHLQSTGWSLKDANRQKATFDQKGGNQKVELEATGRWSLFRTTASGGSMVYRTGVGREQWS